MVKGIIQFSHHLLKSTVKKGEIVIDATCGNGNDTVFLCETVGEGGHVLAFDLQEQAIENTKQLVNYHGFYNVSLIHDSHEFISHYLSPELKGYIGGAIFNLGYLPRSDKQVITKGETTIAAIETILDYLKVGGIVVIVVYHGHKGGEMEKNMVLKYTINLDQKKYNVLQYGFINQKNKPPFIIAIQKK